MTKRLTASFILFLALFSPVKAAQSRPQLQGKGLRFKGISKKLEGYFHYLEGSYLQAQIHQRRSASNLPSLLPCQGTLTSEFGWRRLGKKERMHEGLDIAAPIGTAIVAPADGVVIFAGRKSGYGLTLVIDHGGEISTLFGHNSKLLVQEGETVKQGQEISQVGNSGSSTGPHLHYEIHQAGAPVDPATFI